MKANICLRDFQIMSTVVSRLTNGYNSRDPGNSVTVEYTSTTGGYSLSISVNASINGVDGIFSTEIIGNEDE